MTPPARRNLGIAAMLFIATLAQCVWAAALAVHGAQPDFIAATACLCALFCDADGGASVGFAAGLLSACLAAPPHGGFGSLIVSRTLVGWSIGALEARIFRDNAPLAIAAVALGTLLGELLFFLFAPQHHILHWARTIGLMTLYNTLLALPLYFLLRRVLGASRPRLRSERYTIG